MVEKKIILSKNKQLHKHFAAAKNFPPPPPIRGVLGAKFVFIGPLTIFRLIFTSNNNFLIYPMCIGHSSTKPRVWATNRFYSSCLHHVSIDIRFI